MGPIRAGRHACRVAGPAGATLPHDPTVPVHGTAPGGRSASRAPTLAQLGPPGGQQLGGGGRSGQGVAQEEHQDRAHRGARHADQGAHPGDHHGDRGDAQSHHAHLGEHGAVKDLQPPVQHAHRAGARRGGGEQHRHQAPRGPTQRDRGLDADHDPAQGQRQGPDGQTDATGVTGRQRRDSLDAWPGRGGRGAGTGGQGCGDLGEQLGDRRAGRRGAQQHRGPVGASTSAP